MEAKQDSKLKELLKSGKKLEVKDGEIRAIEEKGSKRESSEPAKRPQDFWD